MTRVPSWRQADSFMFLTADPNLGECALVITTILLRLRGCSIRGPLSRIVNFLDASWILECGAGT